MPNGTSSPNRTAGVVGLGLIGGSIALALRDLGFVVGGADHDESQVDRALDSGIIDHRGLPAEAELTVVATPVDAIPAGRAPSAFGDGGVGDRHRKCEGPDRRGSLA